MVKLVRMDPGRVTTEDLVALLPCERVRVRYVEHRGWFELLVERKGRVERRVVEKGDVLPEMWQRLVMLAD